MGDKYRACYVRLACVLCSTIDSAVCVCVLGIFVGVRRQVVCLCFAARKTDIRHTARKN